MLNLKNINLLELKDLRDKNEIKLYFKAKGIDITDEEISQLKDTYSNLDKSSSELSLEQLNDIAGGEIVVRKRLFHEGYKIWSNSAHSKAGEIKVRTGFSGLLGFGITENIADFVKENTGLQVEDLKLDFKSHNDEANFHYLKALLEGKGGKNLQSSVETALNLCKDSTSTQEGESVPLLATEVQPRSITDNQRAELAASAICAHIDKHVVNTHEISSERTSNPVNDIHDVVTDALKPATPKQKAMITQHVLEHVYHSSNISHEAKAALYHEFKVLSNDGFKSFSKTITYELERRLQTEEQFGTIGSRVIARKELKDFKRTIENTTGSHLMKDGDDLTLVLTSNSSVNSEEIQTRQMPKSVPLEESEDNTPPLMATGNPQQSAKAAVDLGSSSDNESDSDDDGGSSTLVVESGVPSDDTSPKPVSKVPVASSTTSVLTVSHAVSPEVQKIIDATPTEFSEAKDIFVKLDPKTQENLANLHQTVTQRFYGHKEEIKEIFKGKADASRRVYELYKSLKLNEKRYDTGYGFFEAKEIVELFFDAEKNYIQMGNAGSLVLHMDMIGDFLNKYNTFFVNILYFVIHPECLKKFYSSLIGIKSFNADSDFTISIERKLDGPKVDDTTEFMLTAMLSYKKEHPKAKMAYHVFADPYEQGGWIFRKDVSQEERMAEIFIGQLLATGHTILQEYYEHSHKDTEANANKDAFGNPSAVTIPELRAFNSDCNGNFGTLDLNATAIFCAAPDVRGETHKSYKSLGEKTIGNYLIELGKDKYTCKEVKAALVLRWKNTLKACVENGITDFFTGMFGTGVFGNAHGVVRDALAEALATEIGKDKDGNPVRYCDVVRIHLTGIKGDIIVYEEGVKKKVTASEFWNAELIKEKIRKFSESLEGKV